MGEGGARPQCPEQEALVSPPPPSRPRPRLSLCPEPQTQVPPFQPYPRLPTSCLSAILTPPWPLFHPPRKACQAFLSPFTPCTFDVGARHALWPPRAQAGLVVPCTVGRLGVLVLGVPCLRVGVVEAAVDGCRERIVRRQWAGAQP